MRQAPANGSVSELHREQREVVEKPETEVAEVREVFERFGLSPEESENVARSKNQLRFFPSNRSSK